MLELSEELEDKVNCKLKETKTTIVRVYFDKRLAAYCM